MRIALALSFLASAVATQDPAVDDFERHLLGPNWTLLGGSQAGIVNNRALGVPNTNWCFAAWTASAFGADQFSEATIAPDIDPNMLTQVFVRRRASDLARYGFHWNGDPGRSQWEIKYDGVPTAQTRVLASLAGPGPAPGDVLRIEVEGTDPVVIRGYHNSRLELTASDAALQRIAIASPCGVVARMSQGFVNTPPTPIFASWSGGSLVWLDLGNATAGTSGPPVLRGAGALQAGASVTLALLDALPGGIAILVLGTTRLDLPLLGGVLVPYPDLLAVGIPVDGQGRTVQRFAWPGGLNSGFTLYNQFWIPDPGGPQGFAVSNGLLARVP